MSAIFWTKGKLVAVVTAAVVVAAAVAVPLTIRAMKSDGETRPEPQPPATKPAATQPPAEVALGNGDDGRTVELRAGGSLTVTLDSNPSTGYSWAVAEGTGAVLRQDGSATYRQLPSTGGPPRAGTGGTATFRFEAAGKGQATLRLIYRRPWEKDIAPVETFTVTVTVR